MRDQPQPSDDESNRLRRSQWPDAKGRLSDMETVEADLSATTTCEERLAMVWQLTLEAWAMRGEPIGEPGLLRSVARLIRRKG